MNYEEKVTLGENYALSLPYFTDTDTVSKLRNAYYSKLCESAVSFAKEDPHRVRSYRSNFKINESDSGFTVDIQLSARIWERGKSIESRTKLIRDTWLGARLKEHSVTET